MRLILVSSLLIGFLAAPAFAQSKLVIGGVDQRAPPLESQYLAQQLSGAAQQLARASALLQIERQDHQDTQDTATATKAWLDEAWKEMEYWRAYAGFAAP